MSWESGGKNCDLAADCCVSEKARNMGNLNVEEIMDSLSGEELCKYCRYGIDYDCNGGARSDGAGNPIYPPCADGLDEDYFDLDAYLADEKDD